MNESVFSTYWYRVAGLKPVIRDNVVITRHVYRGQTWYVLRNRLNGQHHRFNMAAYSLIGLMDGQRTIEQIWVGAGKISPEYNPTQNEVIRMLGRLHDADLMQCDILPSTIELLQQDMARSKNSLKQKAFSPFSMQFPLWDPDRFLEKWSFLAAPFFTLPALIVWLFVIAGGFYGAVLNWKELSSSLGSQILSQDNLVIIWLLYPILKAFHEAGHAFAVKNWGGEVHKIGIMLLVFVPIPYVDATASNGFPEKHRRIIVAGAGMMIELFIAAAALFVWLNVEPGTIQTLSYNIMLIAGASTLIFNGNPLMRYDGYYILSDLLEIPNLAQRSKSYTGYLVQYYLLGIKTAQSPVTAPGEKTWFILYGPLAWCYRILVLAGLIWMISGRFFFIGVLIAIWGIISLFILPTAKVLIQTLADPEVQKRAPRALSLGILFSALLFLGLCVFPVTYSTNAQGIIRLPEQSIIRAGTDFEVVRVLSPVEEPVKKDASIIKGTDPFLETQIAISRAVLQEQYAAYNALPIHERVKRKIFLEEIERAKGDLHQAELKLQKLIVRSPARGKLIINSHQNLPGRFVRQGEILGHIITDHRPSIRAVVRQNDINLIRNQVSKVRVRLAERIEEPMHAAIERIIPAADHILPSAALGTAGGGIIPVDPGDPDGLRAIESVFQVDLTLPGKVKNPHIGSRVFIRFEHGRKPIAVQWYRTIRQLLLGRFNV